MVKWNFANDEVVEWKDAASEYILVKIIRTFQKNSSWKNNRI